MFQYSLVFFFFGNLSAAVAYSIFHFTLPDAHIYWMIFFLFSVAVMFVSMFVDMIRYIVEDMLRR